MAAAAAGPVLQGSLNSAKAADLIMEGSLTFHFPSSSSALGLRCYLPACLSLGQLHFTTNARDTDNVSGLFGGSSAFTHCCLSRFSVEVLSSLLADCLLPTSKACSPPLSYDPSPIALASKLLHNWLYTILMIRACQYTEKI